MFDVCITRFDKLMGSNLVRPGVVLFAFPNSPYKIVAPTILFDKTEESIPKTCVCIPFDGFNPTKEHGVNGEEVIPFVDLSMMQAIHNKRIGRTIGHVTDTDSKTIIDSLVTYLKN